MLINKLKELGFNLPSYANGVYDCTCPNCSAQRKSSNKKKKVARVWIDDDMITYNCVHCGFKGYIVDEKPVSKKYVRPAVKPRDNLGEKAAAFFKNRGISIETAKSAGVYVEKSKFSKPVLAYPYYKNGVLVNVKYRGIDEKMFMQEKDAEPIFYNYDKCFGKKQIVIVEGENDALALMQVGINNVVSIPCGSINNPIEGESSKFDFIKNSLPLVESCDRFILALDNDNAGRCMTDALIDRLGRAKCSVVDWSKYQVKDSNELLQQSPMDLVELIEQAKPLPLKGIVTCENNEDFEDYIINGKKDGILTGFENLDKLINFQYGDFVTVTGYPGSGKSLFLTNLVMNFAKQGGKCLFFAFENSVNQLKKKWVQMLIEQPVYNPDEYLLNKIRGTYDFLKEHFFIYQDYNSRTTVESILDCAEQAILQEGIKFIVIDPLNKIPYSKSDNSNNDLCSLLNTLTAFAKKNKVVVFLVAHPTKPEKGKLKTVESPSGYDIAGSANFLNMSDVILTVHRKQNDDGVKGNSCKVMISKVRDTDYGHEGSCYFRYDLQSGTYKKVEKCYFDDEKIGDSKW